MRILEIMPDFLNQKELEKIGNERGKHRTNKRRLSHIEREDESVTSYGKVLVANLIKPYAEAINEWVAQASSNVHSKTPIALQKISQIEDPKITALIALKHIMNTITTTKNLTATAIKLGGRIETEISLKNFKNLNPELYAVVKKDLDKRSFNYAYKRRKYREVAKKDEVVSWEEWSTTERLHTGMQLITLMVESVGLIEIGTDQHKHKTFKVIRQTAFTKKWIQDRNSFNELLNPEYLPMVLAPKSVVDGQVQGHGYWTSEMPELDLVKQRGKKFTNELENHDMPEVTSAVNLMQSTAYRINTFILGVMQNAWDKSLSIGGMPPIENLDIPQKPHDIDTNKEALFEYKKACVIVHTENNRMSSKRMLYAKIINLAEQFKEYVTMYFPIQLDFRGRAYCVPAFLNYQSINGAKALLNFSQGKAITKENRGVFWLSVHGANMWGNDKVSFEDREKWTYDNADWIKACAEDPIGNRQWEDADNAFQFLAFCDEWNRYTKEGDGFISHIPVNVDGSCNGLQIYSLLLKDKVAGSLVNCVPSDVPQDIYGLVKNEVVKNAEQKSAEGEELATKWLDYGVKRSTCKRPVMTLTYGSTRYACTDFVVEDLTKRKDKGEMHPFDDLFKPSTYLSKLIWQSIGENLKSAKEGMRYLQDIAKVVAKEGVPIHWVTPVGFPVYQYYPEMKSRRVETHLMGQVIQSTIREAKPETDKMKQRNSCPANYVHSLDSACMIRTVNIAREKGIENFCNVHDSFATHACDIDKLNESIREAFVSIFSKDLLSDFKAKVSETLSDEAIAELPDRPKDGELDLDLLHKCKYFFA
jgi:DNA-directed RNA polymerase